MNLNPKSNPFYPSDLTVTVVIPALNEEDSLPSVLTKIPDTVDEVILVDGHSTDKTVDAARSVLPSIKVIYQTGQGKGNALIEGINAAESKIVVFLDADGSADPSEIPLFVNTLVAGADFAKGSRFLHGAGTTDMEFIRVIANWAFVQLVNMIFRTKYTDITYGYNAIWVKHKDCLATEISGWANEIISNIRVAKHGLRVVEVPCYEHERIAGEAKLHAFSAGLTILKAILKEGFSHPSPNL